MGSDELPCSIRGYKVHTQKGQARLTAGVECATIHVPIGDPHCNALIYLALALHSSVFHKAEKGSSRGAYIKAQDVKLATSTIAHRNIP